MRAIDASVLLRYVTNDVPRMAVKAKELVESGDGGHLDCHACRLRYRIDDGIPVMLIDEAEKF